MHGPSLARVVFDADVAAALSAFADTLIPGDSGFPAPSGVRIVEDFMTRYVSPDDAPVVYLPGVTESDVATLLTALGPGFAGSGAAERTKTVEALERDAPVLFARLRMLVYAGYYSRPEVRSAIATNLEAGRDFRAAPQPYGYADVIEPWDEAIFNRTGTYMRTEDIRPVDPDALARALAAQAAAYGGGT